MITSKLYLLRMPLSPLRPWRDYCNNSYKGKNKILFQPQGKSIPEPVLPQKVEKKANAYRHLQQAIVECDDTI